MIAHWQIAVFYNLVSTLQHFWEVVWTEKQSPKQNVASGGLFWEEIENSEDERRENLPSRQIARARQTEV